MTLRDRKRIFSANFFDGDALGRFAVGNNVMRITCGAQQIAIEAAALAHAGQTSAAIAERNSDRIVRVSWRNQHCNFQFPRRRWWWCWRGRVILLPAASDRERVL